MTEKCPQCEHDLRYIQSQDGEDMGMFCPSCEHETAARLRAENAALREKLAEAEAKARGLEAAWDSLSLAERLAEAEKDRDRLAEYDHPPLVEAVESACAQAEAKGRREGEL